MLRDTQTTYLTDSSHVNANLVRLPQTRRAHRDSSQRIENNYLTSYTYDALADLKNVTKYVTSNNQVRSFTYDGLGRPAAATNPESGETDYHYYNNGLLTPRKDATGVTTTYTYDTLNRLKTKSYSDTTAGVTYTWDLATNGKGRLSSVAKSGVTRNYTAYDTVGHVTASNVVANSYTYNFSNYTMICRVR